MILCTFAAVMENNAEHITGDLEWDGLSRPKIYYAVASLWCGIFLSVMDGNICNVALPTISQELGVSSADSIWVVNSFQLVIMMTLLAFSSLGELLSYKRVYVSGVVLFTVGSLFCALSHTLPLLVASRVFQGIGAAMMMSVNTTLVKITYPKKYLGRGVGLNATVVAGGRSDSRGRGSFVRVMALALRHQYTCWDSDFLHGVETSAGQSYPHSGSAFQF